ncbi:hypothetical protein D3OALGB2SA_4087 [Olavius algarvensis associated proteobacterium Delta 3]|nr:hypothetical protein D3OALGB2SA_4087 [Olavius algarvensis associated proteobacterium Delta 3]
MLLIDRIIDAIMAGILAASVVIAFVAVIFRYVLNSALLWSFEVSLILLTYLTFIGSYAALRRGAHLKVDVIANMLGPIPRTVVFMLAQVVILGVSIVMVIWGTEQALKFASQTTTILEMPRGPIYAIIPLSGLVMGIDTLARLIRGLRRAVHGEAPEQPEDNYDMDK